jgi:hypothetical protein
MKKLIVLIIAVAVKFNLASAADLSTASGYETSYISVLANEGGGDEDLKNKIKELKDKKKALREDEKILNQKLKIKKLEKQAKDHEKRNKHKQLELDHQ